jgi:hypothetical protein
VSAPGQGKTPPPPSDPGKATDLELMLYYDGELEEPRRSEVAKWIDATASARSKLAGLGLAGEVVKSTASDVGARAGGIADLVMARVGEESSLVPKVPSDVTSAPANDNGRLMLTLTALAAAAAAALFFWGRTSPEDVPQAGIPTGEPAASVQPLASAPSVSPGPSAVPTEPQVDALARAEVASVDFGSRMGAVYYVGGAEGSTTTVVWVTDE